MKPEQGIFKSAGMKRANARDQQVSKGKQFGIGNFFSWAMKKYPKLTLGQLEVKMPSLEREYAQEKAMRKAEPEMKPSVNPAMEPEQQAQQESQIARLRQLAGLPITEDDVTKVAVGHVDAEADMLRKELFKIGKYSVELYKMLGDLQDGDFPHWWQAKIVKAHEYLEGAKNYLDAELNAPRGDEPQASPETMDNTDPSGVS